MNYHFFHRQLFPASARMHDSWMPREIIYHSDDAQARFFEKFRDHQRLFHADFHDHLAIIGKMSRHAGRDSAEDIETTWPCAQCKPWLVAAYVGLQSGYFDVVEVRRIRDDYIEHSKSRSSIENVEAVGAPERHEILDLMTQSIA